MGVSSSSSSLAKILAYVACVRALAIPLIINSITVTIENK
ncbi:hypothetical protein HMPREF1602_03945 [Escherichia coli 907889]|nr:putative membrane protein [Escherichia coli]ESA77621.1 hypothetical protein HMPREF1588_01093 [Escherichia coli 110957]ESD36478.1 hypothetical protein HMPREF1602_03945 [Escherichia coli 907889]